LIPSNVHNNYCMKSPLPANSTHVTRAYGLRLLLIEKRATQRYYWMLLINAIRNIKQPLANNSVSRKKKCFCHS